MKYEIPKRYGTCEVNGKEYPGGSIVEMTEKQAKAIGATPAVADPPASTVTSTAAKPKPKADVPPKP